VTRPWKTLARSESRAGPLELRQRGERDFLILLDGRVLMTSTAHHSESALAERACARLSTRHDARVLVGGLGMGFTLRAALDQLPDAASAVVVEIDPRVVEWCRGPLRELSADALADPRVRVELGDVSRAIERASHAPVGERFDAVILDLFQGPRPGAAARGDRFYGSRAIARTRAALRPGGVFAVWSEAPDAGFEKRLAAAGFRVERRREGKGGRRHALYLARIIRGPDQPAADSCGRT
jgi:spermidine synthase